MPIVEYFHRTIASEKAGRLPEAAPEKSGKLPEWAKIVTVVTIFAFVTSSYYVSALANALNVPLAIYFSPADYLRITPSWAVSTVGLGGLFTLLIVMMLVTISTVLKVPKGGISPNFSWQAAFDFFPNMLKRSRIAFVVTVFVVVPAFNGLIFVLPVDYVLGSQFTIISSHSASVAIELFIFYTVVGVSFLPGSAAIKVLLIAIIWCAGLGNGAGYY